eukprot:g17247.t1
MNLDDYRRVMQKLQVPLDEDQVERVFTFADRNKDGRLTFEDYVKLSDLQSDQASRRSPVDGPFGRGPTSAPRRSPAEPHRPKQIDAAAGEASTNAVGPESRTKRPDGRAFDAGGVLHADPAEGAMVMSRQQLVLEGVYLGYLFAWSAPPRPFFGGLPLRRAAAGSAQAAMAPPKKQAVPLQAYNRHIVSEHLKDPPDQPPPPPPPCPAEGAWDRHPYLEDIRGHLKADEVSTAQGERLFPRLVEQLSAPEMAAEKLVEALNTICDLCSHQESKTVAISSDVIAAATHLLMHESVLVRRAAARVLSSMALLIGGRSLLPIGSSPLADRLVEQSGPALPRLAKLLLSCDDELVKLHVAEAFQAATIFRDGCQQVVNQGSVMGITQYMCGTLPDPTRVLRQPVVVASGSMGRLDV